MYFRPRLPGGRVAPMTWQIRMLSVNVCWPLETRSSWIWRNLDPFLVITSFILYSLCNVAAVNYIISHTHNVDLMLDALAPYLLLLDFQFRIYSMAFHKKDFRKLLEEFYAKIYIERESNELLFRSIKRNMLPTVIHSYTVFGTFFANTLVIALSASQRLLPYKMLFPFDYTQLAIYIPILAINFWLGVMQTTCLIGESNILATCILHLNARYQLLQQDCQNLQKSLLHFKPDEAISYHFHQGLTRIILRNVELNEFAAKLQIEYSFRVFIMMGMSSIFMCVLGFMPLTFGVSSKSAAYLIWFIGKTLDLFIFGRLGSKLITTTSKMGSMYYGSNWEDIIQRSPNGVENAKIMKLIALAIEMHQKPMYVTGLCFFNLSLPSVLAILQAAYTYFSCLYALHFTEE